MPNAPHTASAARLVSLADEEAVKDILTTTVLDLWKVVSGRRSANAIASRSSDRRARSLAHSSTTK